MPYPENLKCLDDFTARALGLIHYYHLLTREVNGARTHLDWIESELARLEEEMPSALVRTDDGIDYFETCAGSALLQPVNPPLIISCAGAC